MCEGKSPVCGAIPRQSDRASVHLSVIRQMINEEAILKKYSTAVPRSAEELRQRYINAMYFLLDLADDLGVDDPAYTDLLLAASEFEWILHPFDYAMSQTNFAKDIESVLSAHSVLDRFKPMRY